MKSKIILFLSLVMVLSLCACNTSAFTDAAAVSDSTAAASANSGILQMVTVVDTSFLPEEESDADVKLSGPYANIPVICPEEICFGMLVRNDGADQLNVDVGGEIFKIAAQTEVWIYSAEPYCPDAGARSDVQGQEATVIGFSTKAGSEMDGTMQIWLFDSAEGIPVPVAQL